MLRPLLATLALAAGAFTGLAWQPATALSCGCLGEQWQLALASTTCDGCELPQETALTKTESSLWVDLGADEWDLAEPAEEEE